jgi:3-deoxy-D-manno-octulosonic-acid transferase
MTILYSIFIYLFYLAVMLAAPFNQKARLWIAGRMKWRARLKHWNPAGAKVFWFHAASLGEFEQGRPLIEALKEQLPHCKIVLTFFSPSGYEIRKNFQMADLVCYLPLDTRRNSRDFIGMVKPDAAFFIKYEFWYFFLLQLRQAGTPVYLVSGIFRKSQAFFHPYGFWSRRKLKGFTHFFVQDEASADHLKSIHLNNTSVTGDTRFDRVADIAAHARTIEIAAIFAGGSFCVVAGSTWPHDEDILASYISTSDESTRFIIAPHEVDEGHISRLQKIIKKNSIRFSHADLQSLTGYQVLIIDNIGMLSSLYRYGQIAYIGGGFGKGIHNILEAAAYGMPVVFGPNYQKFREAKDMIASGAAFSISSLQELVQTMNRLMNHKEIRLAASEKAKEYIALSRGATNTILQMVFDRMPPAQHNAD